MPWKAGAYKTKVKPVVYYAVAALQVLSLFFFYCIATLLAASPFIIKYFFPHLSYNSLAVMCLESILFSYPVLLVMSIIMKWLVIGKFKEGVYPLWGFYYFRFWLVKKFVDITPVVLLTGTPFLAIYYRLMGMKIGKKVYLGSDRVRIFDLVSIGDNSSISKEAYLMGYTVEDGMLKLGRISIGNNCFVGARSLLHQNSLMEDDSSLLELSMLPGNVTIPAGKVWRGSPAKEYKNEYDLLVAAKKKPSTTESLFKKIGLATIHGFALLIVLLVPWILLIPYSLAIYFLNSLEGIWLTLIMIIPLSALYILTFCLCTAALKWIVLGKMKPGDIPIESVLYIRKWFVDSLIAMSLLMSKIIVCYIVSSSMAETYRCQNRQTR